MSSKSNEVREALHRVVAQEGPGCLKDVRRFRSLWLDYAPAQSKEAKLILSAVQEGVGGILINALDQDDAEKKRSIKRCEQQLADAYITGDGARFAVREIASALRMDVDRLVPLSEAETISANQLPQREPKSVPADQMPGAHRKSTSSPQESPQSLERETTKRDPGYEEFLANNAAKEAPVRRKKSSLVPLLALMLAAGAAAGWFLNKGSADVPDVPAVVAPADAQTDQESLPAIIPPVLPDEDDEAESAAPSDDKNLEGIVPPILPVEDVESVVPPEDENVKEIIPPVLPAKDEEKEPEEPVQQETKPYLIDTVAANLNDFKSMVLDNQNNLYYINGGTVYCTKNNTSLELSDATAYLAHDPYNDIVYLLVGANRIEIFDITDLQTPELMLDQENCPALDECGCGSLAWYSSIAPQIAVLKNGALLVPFGEEVGRSTTWMVNIPNKTIIRTAGVYRSYTSYYKVIDDKLMYFDRGGETKATIADFSSPSDSTEIQLGLAEKIEYIVKNNIYYGC